MKVLLVSPNREQLPDPAFPLGLACLVGPLRQRGHDLQAVDLCFSDDADGMISRAISSFGPDAVGISLRNIDDVSYPKRHSYLGEYRETVRAVRRYSDAPVILGGSGFTIMPEEFMRELGADYGITGEGEAAFPLLLERLRKGSRIPRGRIFASRSRMASLDAVTPERDLFDSASYYRFGGMLNVQTKRGCAFRCSYCTYPMVEGRRVRMRTPASVADEIEQAAAATGARHFFIVDSVFNYPVAHAEAVCREIIRRGLDISWSCYATPAPMTPDLADLMVRAGCTGVEFGIDSLDDNILQRLGKGFRYRRVQQASAACRSADLKFCHFVFAGSPGDTDETARRTLGRLEELDPDAAVIMTGIRIFPATRLAEMARGDLGITQIGLEPVFYLSPLVRNYDRIAEEVSRHRRWVMPGYGINLHSRLQKRLRERGIKGSLWEELAKRT